LKNIGI